MIFKGIDPELGFESEKIWEDLTKSTDVCGSTASVKVKPLTEYLCKVPAPLVALVAIEVLKPDYWLYSESKN